MKKRNYQKLTEKIARDGGLATDLKANFDPIYINWMKGDFYRGLLHYSKHSIIKLIVSIGLFIVPGLYFWFEYLKQIYDYGIKSQEILSVVGAVIFYSLLIYAGVRILFSGFKDLVKSKK
jgi:hypothetical protein